ncbi:hypothetical protein C8R45DRAFT_1005864 [Mycena sanguinolenta]|nr:hypothetical protein C8R45DRAFT_1005864 [Mycena sanguinolenta]
MGIKGTSMSMSRVGMRVCCRELARSCAFVGCASTSARTDGRTGGGRAHSVLGSEFVLVLVSPFHRFSCLLRGRVPTRVRFLELGRSVSMLCRGFDMLVPPRAWPLRRPTKRAEQYHRVFSLVRSSFPSYFFIFLFFYFAMLNLTDLPLFFLLPPSGRETGRAHVKVGRVVALLTSGTSAVCSLHFSFSTRVVSLLFRPFGEVYSLRAASSLPCHTYLPSVLTEDVGRGAAGAGRAEPRTWGGRRKERGEGTMRRRKSEVDVARRDEERGGREGAPRTKKGVPPRCRASPRRVAPSAH